MMLDWISTIVTLINVSQLTAISVRYAYDWKGFARDFAVDLESSASASSFDFIFGLWVACLVTRLVRNALIGIGKAIDCEDLTLVSSCLDLSMKVVVSS